MKIENTIIVPINTRFVNAWKIGKVTIKSMFDYRIENIVVYRRKEVQEFESTSWTTDDVKTVSNTRQYIILKDGI